MRDKGDSCAGAIERLIESGHSKDVIFDALNQQKVEIVLTAHPTEVNRRTILDKHERLKVALDALDGGEKTPYEQRQIEKALHTEIASIWETDELRRSKPTPVEEAISGYRREHSMACRTGILTKTRRCDLHTSRQAFALGCRPIEGGILDGWRQRW